MRDAFLFIDGLEAGVRLLNCGALEIALPTVLAQRPHEIIPFEKDPPTFASVICADGRYRVHAPRLGKPTYQKDAVNAACDLAGVIARHIASLSEDQLMLHAAAVEIGDALVVFPAGRRAGKSLLTVALAQLGARVFGDDVLPITLNPGAPIKATALGIAPRVRLPLPEPFGQLAQKLEAAPSIENDQYRYVALPELAPAGEQGTVGAFVTLTAAETGKPALRPVSPGTTLGVLLKQNFGRRGSAEMLLSGLSALVDSAQTLELSYTDPLTTAAFLMDELAAQLEATAPTLRLEGQTTTPVMPSDKSVPNGNAPYRRREGAILRNVDGECFAASLDGNQVLRMNEGSRQIWELLSEPTSQEEIVDLMRTAFSEVPPERIASDVARGLTALTAAGLIEPCVAFSQDGHRGSPDW